ncbi:hypothetical protein B0H11DRAFT_2277684 [Mycena galericulata]|nr:hypothetical protein B0H11DRAFT_2277684 [Mycena galericulata]
MPQYPRTFIGSSVILHSGEYAPYVLGLGLQELRISLSTRLYIKSCSHFFTSLNVSRGCRRRRPLSEATLLLAQRCKADSSVEFVTGAVLTPSFGHVRFTPSFYYTY